MGALKRSTMIKELARTQSWDLLVIGGGATGLGTAVDAASRGYRTLLIEQNDFAKGTSSRSTKLAHGGVRYLKQGNVALVIEALKERGYLCQNAPHLVHHLPFLVPNYHWWEGPFYGVGLKVYDFLAGKLGIEKSIHLSKDEVLKRLPTIEPKDLYGGIIYYDGQFDDARLAITLAQTAADHGACLLNYMKATRLIKEGKLLKGVVAQDAETKEEVEIFAKAIINATGAFTDSVRALDDQTGPNIIAPSQGIHLVLDKSFLASDTAIMIPHTDDGRVVFFIPWLDHVLIGTTDTPIKDVSLEPKPMHEEIEFLLRYAKRYLTKDPTPNDCKSVFAGIRPLVKAGNGENTAKLSRDHVLHVSESGLITIAGGKWTTYRKMAEDVVKKAILVAHLKEVPCKTESLLLHGYAPANEDPFSMYGMDAQKIKELPHWDKPLHQNLPYRIGHVLWAVQEEMARTLEDVLARRTRALFLNAGAAIEIAPTVAKIIAQELDKDASWEKEQVSTFATLAQNYKV